MQIDLHVHSKFSRRPSAWFLKRIGCPESFTEPLQVYHVAKARGMSHVTITDHNRIDGALEIAHLADVFISEEVTTYFPADRCKLHVLALDITEAQHRDIQKIRENVFDLLAYFRRESVVHVLAHPLYRVNDRLTVDHFEQLLLMFENFELNGARNDETNDLLKGILGQLTRQDMVHLADKHGIEPCGACPWIKNMTGGSDDHSSLNIARAFTRVRGADTLDDFFHAVSHQQGEVVRNTATPKTMAHNLYSIAYQYYRNKFDVKNAMAHDDLIGFMDRSLLCHADLNKPGLMRRLSYLWQYRRRRKKQRAGSRFLPDSLTGLLRQESRRMMADNPDLKRLTAGEGAGPLEENWFDFVNQASSRVMKQFADHLMDHLSGADVFNLFQTIGAAGGLYTLLAPYFIAYSLFTRDRELNRRIARRFDPESPKPINDGADAAVAHFTDTFYEINGVALTLQQQVAVAGKNGKQLTVLTCEAVDRPELPDIRNFKPMGVYELPEYPEQKIFYPPLLEMMVYCYEKKITHIHSATPGPVGLAALAISKILKLPIIGTYHTQLPQYAMLLTGDSVVEDLTWKYTLWYYDQMDVVYAPSESTRAELLEKGLRPEKVKTYPRGIDTERFHPVKRNGILQDRWRVSAQTVFLYVGRVSKEKNLELLADAFVELSGQRKNVHLMVVGHGPYLEEMKKALAETPCTFTGYLEGETLAQVYASCDAFVFPSDTDTFGNVVMEAQASGIPVIISDQGGPMENVTPDKTALILRDGTVPGLVKLMEILADDPITRGQMGREARQYAEKRSFDRAFMQSWRMYAEPGENCEAMRSFAG